MKWIAERDHLIAQTMAFVQSVTGKKPEATVRIEVSPSAAVVGFETLQAPVEAASTVRKPAVAASPLRAEIEGRVAAFRAHQQRFDRERDKHFKSVLTGIRAAITDSPSSSPP